jgi:hypothetical protein
LRPNEENGSRLLLTTCFFFKESFVTFFEKEKTNDNATDTINPPKIPKNIKVETY